MWIIDRYLLRQFITTFLICFLSLTGLFVVFDAFTNLDTFLTCAKGGQLLRIMAAYYGFQSIFFFDRTSSLLVLMAAMFTVAWIQRHNEMTALMAAGVSRVRIVMPVIVAAALVTALAVVNREVMIPRFKDQLAQRPGDLKGSQAKEVNLQEDEQTGILIDGKAVYKDLKRVEKPCFRLPGELSDYGKQLSAENAFYEPPSDTRPGGYRLEGVTEPKNLAKRPSLLSAGRPVIITPHDAPDWLKPDQCFVASDVTFDQLVDDRTIRSFASTVELIQALRNRNVEYRADFRVAIHARLVQPVLDITLLFLGLPLIVMRESRNVFLAIGMCIGVVTLFLVLAIGCQQLGTTGLLPPSLAAWIPLMIFVPAAVVLAETMWER